MKVAFWSNARGKSCVTSNLACISVLSILGSDSPDKRTIIFENHQNIINLGNVLICPNSKNEVCEQNQYYVEQGLSKVLCHMEMGDEPSEEQIFRYSRQYLGKQLFYLSSQGTKNGEVLEYQLERECIPTIQCLEKYSNRVFVDTAATTLVSSRKILQQSDVIVVNLNQNHSMLEHFFGNYSSIQSKAFYVIGNYDGDAILTRGMIMQKYHIPGRQIAVIPHCAQFSDALSEGMLIPFLLANYYCDRDSPNYSFIQGAKEAVQLFENHLCSVQERGG
ncbi:MAG: hypothetical protein J5988_08845 [Eubacterium sp.]|nr:hypothetical protein [Eubacterium sp.]